MLDLENEELKIKIAGQYNDGFLYAGELFLITDEELVIVDYTKLVDKMSRGLSEDLRILARYAFLHNEFFYDKTSSVNDLFKLSFVRKGLLKIFSRLSQIEADAKILKSCIRSRYKHGLPGAIHLEIYKSNIFISNDSGTFIFKNEFSEKNKLQKISENSAINISAQYGDEIRLSGGHNGLEIIGFENLKLKRAISKTDYTNRLDETSVYSEPIYYDLVNRAIDNRYSFLMNVNRHKDYSERRISGRRREATPPTFIEVSVRDKEEKSILKNAKFVSGYGSRLLTIKENELKMFRFDFDLRTKMVREGRVRANMEPLDLYEETGSFQIRERDNAKIGEIYSGFQTVFGFVLDTSGGTYVIDDKVENDGTGGVSMRKISQRENVKVRHFQRAINYSHTLLNVKNNHLEIYTDLTNYFFPPNQRKIRIRGLY